MARPIVLNQWLRNLCVLCKFAFIIGSYEVRLRFHSGVPSGQTWNVHQHRERRRDGHTKPEYRPPVDCPNLSRRRIQARAVPWTRIPTEEAEDHDTDLRLWKDGVYRSEVRESGKESSHESCRRTQEERHSHPSKAGNSDPEHGSLSRAGRTD